MDAARNVFDNFNHRIFHSLRYFSCNRPDFFRKLLRIREYGWDSVRMRRKKKGRLLQPPFADFRT
jgi:hypothetical protein